MSARFAPRIASPLWLALPFAFLALFSLAGPSALAAEAAATERFDEQLAAGEFAPALATARELEDAALRDALLVKLARAQANGGDRQSAFYTLAAVSDDRTRSGAIQSTSLAFGPGARGGVMADFDTLMDLITETVSKDSWEEGGGVGKGKMEPFANGVYVDASGVLKRAVNTAKAPKLAATRLAALQANGNADSRRDAPLRKVSLTRLEKHVQLALAAGRRLDRDMLNLAGLEKINYVMVYPETGDLVVAGPAGDWRVDGEGRRVSRTSGRPILQLDDLVVVLRYISAAPQATFGCSIDPTPEGLARTKQFAEASSKTPLAPGQRPAWLKKLRDQMGRQLVNVEGIDPRTRVAGVLVEADYRMKLVGMGLEPGTVDVPSYLALLNVPRGGAPPALDVLRWWFTLKYDAVHATESRDVFEIRGPGVQVLSENEMLTARGEQIHTGQSNPTNAEFAQRFTEHFADLAKKYPVYADLQNIFDLALVSALVNSEKLADRVNWHLTCFNDPNQYQPALGAAPHSVDSVINHRLVNGKHVVVGVSGGVTVEPWSLVSQKNIQTDTKGELKEQRVHSQADAKLPLEAWWWD